MRTATTYLGLQLEHPFIAGASPLGYRVDTVKRLEDAGCAAVVLHSLFEEQITYEAEGRVAGLDALDPGFDDVYAYFPPPDEYPLRPEEYAEHVRRLKEAVRIPIIASLNGRTKESWLKFAKTLEQAGADALELNIYYLPTDPSLSSAELEDTYVALVRDIRAQVRIPLAVKLSPFFTALPHIATRFVDAGANGLVLFNRFYQPDFDLDTLEVVPNLTLSTSADLRLPLRWVAILYGRVDADLALTGGVHSGLDVLKAMMAGARVAMLASELIARGPERLADILAELQAWMQEREYESIAQMQGSMSQIAVAAPAAFERANYLQALSTFDDRLV